MIRCLRYCFPFLYDSDKCIICYDACSTRTCECSFMHKECAQEYYKKHRSRRCRLCKSPYSFTFLQSAHSSNETFKLVNAQKRIQDLKEKKLIRRFKKWDKIIWPAIIASVDHHENLHCVESVLISVTQDDSDTLKQRLMDKGVKNVNENLKEIEEVVFLWDTYSKKVKSALYKGMRNAVLNYDSASM